MEWTMGKHQRSIGSAATRIMRDSEYISAANADNPRYISLSTKAKLLAANASPAVNNVVANFSALATIPQRP
jgi:hypothetical protein